MKEEMPYYVMNPAQSTVLIPVIMVAELVVQIGFILL